MQPDPRSEVDTMVADLRAKLDADERAARAVQSQVWAVDSAWLTDMLDPLPSQLRERPGWVPMITVEDIRHIARHDPARVLALVAAHREILDLYETAKADPDREHDPHVNSYIGGLNAAVTRLASAYADRNDGSGRRA